MSVWDAKAIDEAKSAIKRRAAQDSNFRELALENPYQAVKEVMGREVPKDFKLRFVSNEGANATFVLPDIVAKGAVLSDSDLEQVAGGGRYVGCPQTRIDDGCTNTVDFNISWDKQ